MEWINVKDRFPESDKTVFVTNSNVPMMPVKAYYSKEWEEFLDMEAISIRALSVTHWKDIPERPKK